MKVTRISCSNKGSQLPSIAHQNWVPADRVSASFDISHRGTSIILKFLVREPQVRAVNTEFNSSVWEDSCVEFFISLEGDDNYYNFEFNAIGMVLGQYGAGRPNRQWISPEILAMIQTTPSLGKGVIENMEGDISWELDVNLPVKAFCHHEVEDISRMKARANFYKCGDMLKKPHYLSWNPVLTETPEYHSPQYFRNLDFD